MKKILLLAILLATRPSAGLVQTTEELVNDGQNTDNVTTQSMGYDRKSYSPPRANQQVQHQPAGANLERESDE